MANFLVTGANRGLGLALVSHLLSTERVSTIFAAARKYSTALNRVIDESGGRVILVEIEITKPASFPSAVNLVERKLGAKGLDVLINCAGVMPSTEGGTPAMDDLTEVLDVNVTGVHRMIVAFLPLLRKGMEKKVVNISSTMGSLAMVSHYKLLNSPAYKISKTALNMLTVQWAEDLGDEGFIFMLISPGWLKTEMGKDDADLSVEAGAQAVMESLMKADKSANGRFHNIRVAGWEDAKGPNSYDGKSLPW